MDIVITEPGKPSNPFLDRIKLIQGDITNQDVDAIVSLLPQTLDYRGEINTSILAACGQQLDEFILEHVTEPVYGDIYAVPGFNLRCKHIFFCIIPPKRTDFDRDDRFLLGSARKAMELARDMGLKTIAFPPMGSGKNSFPKPRAARLILQGIIDRLDNNFDDVRLVSLKGETRQIFHERLLQIGWQG